MQLHYAGEKLFKGESIYSVDGPNSLWHIHGNHKLIRWKVVIHGGIDGHSRTIVFIQCATNNRADTVATQCIQRGSRAIWSPSKGTI